MKAFENDKNLDAETILKLVQDMVQADGNTKNYKIHPGPPLGKEGNN